MLDELKKYFGEDITYEELKEKPKVPLFLAKRDMYRVKIGGLSFVLVRVGVQEEFGISALRKQRDMYTEQFQCNVAYCFENVSRIQRESLIKNSVCFVSFPGQVYLPFLGVVLSENFKKEKKIKTEKMMPATQALFLYLLYQKEKYVLKSMAAEALGLTRTSITRASDQLSAMGLIEQEKVGKEIRMFKKNNPKEMLESAKPYLISPIQKKLVVRNESIQEGVLNAGETALSLYSMLNTPKIRAVATYKAVIDSEMLEEVDARWEDEKNVIEIELWKYDPWPFANEGRVDQVSLACSMADCKDERIEMAIEEMLEGYYGNWNGVIPREI